MNNELINYVTHHLVWIVHASLSSEHAWQHMSRTLLGVNDWLQLASV
jgi:hypothetical protein